MGTQAIESADGLRHQTGGGPALGLWQMEGRVELGDPDRTHEDIWRNFLGFRPRLGRLVAAPAELPAPYGPPWPKAVRLVADDAYACAMARVQYYRAREPIPAADDIEAMDRLYLLRYNAGGASKPGEFTAAYRELVAPLFAGG